MLIAIHFGNTLHAQAGGSGHYIPRATASLIRGTEAEQGVVAWLNVPSYEATYERSRSLPVAGVLAGGFDTQTFATRQSLFWRPRIEPDSGDRARLGAFEGRTSGLDPELSYMPKLGTHPMMADGKWLPEIETSRREEGNHI